MGLNFYDGVLRRRLAAVAYELANVIHSLGQQERPRDCDDSVAERHERRKLAIRQRIDAELKKGRGITLPLLKAEFERDLNGILGELLAWQERLDARSQDSKSH